MNNAPAGADLAAPVRFDPATAAGLKARDTAKWEWMEVGICQAGVDGQSHVQSGRYGGGGDMDGRDPASGSRSF